MPILEVRKTKEIILPRSGAKVEVYDDILYGDTILMNETKSETDKQLLILGSVIKGWDFTDTDGRTLPVTEENIKKLSVSDIAAIMESYNELTKKKEA